MPRLKALKPRVAALTSRIAQPVGDERSRHRQRDAIQPWRSWYKTARWQKLRWSILVRDMFTCQICKRIDADTSKLVCDHGDLVVCSEPDQDIFEIADICERLFDECKLPEKAGIGLDAYGVASLLDELAERGLEGDLLLAVGQGWKLQSAINTLPRKLKDKTLQHCGQPLMAWAVGNAKTELRGSNYLVTKQAAGASKIDPLMALFNAAMLMFLNPEPRKAPTFQMYVFG